jgi:tetratricopeptide (TPR) repeat protein
MTPKTKQAFFPHPFFFPPASRIFGPKESHMAQPKKKTPAKKGPVHPTPAKSSTSGTAAKEGLLFYPWLVLVVMALAVAIAYWSALDNQFVDWDDPAYVTENNLLKPATAESLNALWKTVISLNYHPLTMSTLWWNAANTGTESARPYIAFNLFLHVLNSLLAFWLAWRVSGKKLLIAALVGIGFGLHPMHVESVVWVAERKDVLYVFFFFLAALSYWRYLEKPGVLLWLLALVFFVLSCLSKAMAVSLVPVLFLFDWWKGRNLFSTKAVLDKIPFAGIAILFGLIALDIQGGGSFGGWLNTVERQDAISDFDLFTLFERLQFAAYGFMMYIVKLIAPFGQSAFYPYPPIDEFRKGLPVFWFALLFFIACMGLSLFFAKRYKVLAFGLGFYFFTVALVLQVISVGAVVMADRYTYLPYWGLFFLLGFVLNHFLEKQPKLKLAFAIGLLALSLFYIDRTRARVEVWQNHDSLWTNVIEQYPRAGEPRQIRGHHYGKTGRIDLAIADFEAALATGYQSVSIYEGLGNAYGTQGKTDQAIQMFNRALGMDSTNVSVHYNRAIASLNADPQSSIRDLDYVITHSLVPKASNYSVRGFAKLRLSQFAASVKDYDEAIRLDPNDPFSFFNRGQGRQFSGDQAGAIQDYQKALQLKPGMPEATQKLKELGL